MKSNPKLHSKSLGGLFPLEKTKPKSPDMTGKLRILTDTLLEIINTHRDEDGDIFEANIAGWVNDDRGQSYITVELSPPYRPMIQASKKHMTVQGFVNEIIDKREREKNGKQKQDRLKAFRLSSK